MTELWQRSVIDLATDVRSGSIAAAELLEQCIERVEKANGDLNAFVFTDYDQARALAAEVDDAVRGGVDPGPLAGVPFGVKELEPVGGWPYTEASKVFADRIATSDSTQVSRLRAAGAIPIGLTAAPEFGTLSFTRSLLHGTTCNPWSLEHTPGGSSGGSAAAVAAGLVPFCTGSDGGGSIRIPAAYSGLFGPKLTWGRISHGPKPFASDLTSMLGPMTTSVADAARFIDCVVGLDVQDRWSLPHPGYSYEDALTTTPLEGLQVTWSASLGYGVCDPEVARIAEDAAGALVAAARLARVDQPVELPDTATAWGILGSTDQYRKLIPYWPDCRDDLTPAVRLSMENADLLNRRRQARAISARIELDNALSDLFEETDLLLTPTTATVALSANGRYPEEIAGQPVRPMGSLPFTYPFNLSGHPAASVPAGLTADGLPVGLQIVGRVHEDHLVLAAAAALEAARPWPRFAPYASTI